MDKTESIIKLALALCKFNSEVLSISKDAKNPFFKSDYVTLDKLILATRELLQKNGLSVLQMPLSKETGEIGIQTILLHESGEYIQSQPLFMKPVKNDPQAAGSLITYLRRYSYQSILNLNTGEDDDGEMATKASKNNKGTNINDKSYSKGLTDAQVKRLYTLGSISGFDKEKVDNQIFTRFNKKAKELLKTEYDTVCSGYGKMKKAVE